MRTKKVLHVGCGCAALPEVFDGWHETRLDIEDRYKPDIVASMTDMGSIGTFDAVYSSHCLEHLTDDDLPIALFEVLRVLRPDGVFLAFVPDTEGVVPDDEVLFEAPIGPITGRDLWYGYGPALADRPAMAHHQRFTAESLRQAILDAGFQVAHTGRASGYNLWAVAFANPPRGTDLFEHKTETHLLEEDNGC